MDPATPRRTTASTGFPRRRGDGPRVRLFAGCHSLFPPQARGWTPSARRRWRPSSVSPAGAGMDPRWRTGGFEPRSFPRRRGDGPSTRSPPPAGRPFPPQARGWTSSPTTRARGTGVSPAGAGMDREPRRRPRRRGRFPRRRGDGPQGGVELVPDQEFPPQARGWTVPPVPHPALRGVSPAGAGMDPWMTWTSAVTAGFPRRRGDGPLQILPVRNRRQFPPQARGWTVLPALPPGRSDVSPAGAGMDPCISNSPSGDRSFPRRRGDGPRPLPIVSTETPFPPQARGWTSRPSGPGPAPAVSPAGAGMDLIDGEAERRRKGFPRRRGDGPRVVSIHDDTNQFPPQARGWTPGRRALPGVAGVSPAGAGMDPGRGAGETGGVGFPRRRGDGPQVPERSSGSVGFPPQARGWTSRCRPKTPNPTVSPAGAGMDPPSAASTRSRRRFPRRRGDGPYFVQRTVGAPEFPPQARGWTPASGRSPRVSPVSPAGAGMDRLLR